MARAARQRSKRRPVDRDSGLPIDASSPGTADDATEGESPLVESTPVESTSIDTAERDTADGIAQTGGVGDSAMHAPSESLSASADEAPSSAPSEPSAQPTAAQASSALSSESSPESSADSVVPSAKLTEPVAVSEPRVELSVASGPDLATGTGLVAALENARPTVNLVSGDDNSSQPQGDADLLDPAEFSQRPFPAGVARTGEFQPVIRRSVLNEIHRHGQSTLDVEICGVLVGNGFRDETGVFLVIDGSIRGSHATSRNAQVTFTAETWAGIQAEMEANHPHRKIVGWYHTHPGFGIFLSDMDLFIHGNFFNLSWQVALVYDPKSGEEGIFVWRAGKTERVPIPVEEDTERDLSGPPAAAVTPELVGELAWQLTRIQKRLKTMTVWLGVTIAVALVWPFILITAMSDSKHLRPIPVAAPAQVPNTTLIEPVDEAIIGQSKPGMPDGTAATKPTASLPDASAATAPATTRPAANPQAPTGTGGSDLPPPATRPVAVPDVTPTPPPAPNTPATLPATPELRQPPEIIRGTVGNDARGPKVIDTQPDNPVRGSPR